MGVEGAGAVVVVCMVVAYRTAAGAVVRMIVAVLAVCRVAAQFARIDMAAVLLLGAVVVAALAVQ